MLIRVQTPDGQFRVEVEDTWTLIDFKRAVEKACNVRTWDQEFSRDIGGRQKIPDDGRSLRSLNVTCVCNPSSRNSEPNAVVLMLFSAAARRHGEQLYLNDLSKSVAVYSAPSSTVEPDVLPARAPPGKVQARVAAVAMQPQADALRETTSPPIDPLSAPAASPSSPVVQEERRRERKMAPMARRGAPPPMVTQSSSASGAAGSAPQLEESHWEMDM